MKTPADGFFAGRERATASLSRLKRVEARHSFHSACHAAGRTLGRTLVGSHLARGSACSTLVTATQPLLCLFPAM